MSRADIITELKQRELNDIVLSDRSSTEVEPVKSLYEKFDHIFILEGTGLSYCVAMPADPNIVMGFLKSTRSYDGYSDSHMDDPVHRKVLRMDTISEGLGDHYVLWMRPEANEHNPENMVYMKDFLLEQSLFDKCDSPDVLDLMARLGDYGKKSGLVKKTSEGEIPRFNRKKRYIVLADKNDSNYIFIEDKPENVFSIALAARNVSFYGDMGLHIHIMNLREYAYDGLPDNIRMFKDCYKMELRDAGQRFGDHLADLITSGIINNPSPADLADVQFWNNTAKNYDLQHKK